MQSSNDSKQNMNMSLETTELATETSSSNLTLISRPSCGRDEYKRTPRNDDGECCICMEADPDADRDICDQCVHWFHSNCIRAAVTTSSAPFTPRCPLCRSDLTVLTHATLRAVVARQAAIRGSERATHAPTNYIHPSLLPPIIPVPGETRTTPDGSVWMFDGSTHQFILVRRIGEDGVMEYLDNITGQWHPDLSSDEEDLDDEEYSPSLQDIIAGITPLMMPGLAQPDHSGSSDSEDMA